MSGRSYGKSWAIAVLAVTPLLTGGCVQATRHSNTMLFGTNTTFGIKAGANATQTPAIQVGYDRQEAVILPLVANTADVEAGGKSRLVPCDVGSRIIVPGAGEPAIHPCLLFAAKGDSRDAPSALASFGADFGASASTDGPKAEGGLAQYFATGIAAQLLAATGGAAVVNSTAKPTDASGAAAAAVVFGTAEDAATGVDLANAYSVFRKSLVAQLGSGTEAEMKANLAKFETAIGAVAKLSPHCPTQLACLKYMSDSDHDPFDGIFRADQAKVEGALDNWGK